MKRYRILAILTCANFLLTGDAAAAPPSPSPRAPELHLEFAADFSARPPARERDWLKLARSGNRELEVLTEALKDSDRVTPQERKSWQQAAEAALAKVTAPDNRTTLDELEAAIRYLIDKASSTDSPLQELSDPVFSRLVSKALQLDPKRVHWVLFDYRRAVFLVTGRALLAARPTEEISAAQALIAAGQAELKSADERILAALKTRGRLEGLEWSGAERAALLRATAFHDLLLGKPEQATQSWRKAVIADRSDTRAAEAWLLWHASFERKPPRDPVFGEIAKLLRSGQNTSPRAARIADRIAERAAQSPQ